jgi:hypothetical protein
MTVYILCHIFAINFFPGLHKFPGSATGTTLPDLVFDSHCVSAAFQDRSVIKKKLKRNIDHVLLLHFGQINKFKLSQADLISVTASDRWSIKETIYLEGLSKSLCSKSGQDSPIGYLGAYFLVKVYII